MRINFLYKGVLVAAALCVAPAVLATSARAGQPAASTVNSNGAFANDAATSLEKMQTDAIRVKEEADTLQALSREPYVGNSLWRDDGDLLNRVRQRVNDMANLLGQLRVNEAEASRREQRTIDRITPAILELADATQAAIVSLNQNQDQIYFSNLADLSGAMYNEATQVSQVVGNFEKYAKVRQELQQLAQTRNNS